MEPVLGRAFHSSATGRRREQLFLSRPVFVKHLAREMTLQATAALAAEVLAAWPR
jgi:hypothetical protein